MSSRLGALIGAVSLLLSAIGVSAQDMHLTARDGSISISGNFLSFDGEFYRVDTDLGVLTVDSAGVSCEGPGCLDIDNFVAPVRISGETQVVAELIPALVTSFAARAGYTVERVDDTLLLKDAASGDVRAEFTLLPTSSTEGFADLVAETTDIVVAMRPALPREVALAGEAAVADLTDPLRARVLALDALVPIVSRSNPVAAMSLDELAALFAGQTTSWAELTGRDAPVILHLHADDRDRAGSFWRLVMAGPDLALSPDIIFHETYAAVAAAVERDPYAIGIGRLSAGGDVGHVGLSGPCGFAAEAAPSDVKTEDYPMTRPVFAYTPARRLPKVAREFLTYAVSPPAQLVVARSRFVDQGVDLLSFRDQGRRFANAILQAGEEVGLEDIKEVTSVLQGAQRLTLGFRFEDGSTRLDAQSRSNAVTLASLLEAGVYDGRQLVFAGFSDGAGAADVNRVLSKRRADAVLETVRRAAGEGFDDERVTLSSLGFGEAMPLACDDIAWGRSLNRRVEVWLRD